MSNKILKTALLATLCLWSYLPTLAMSWPQRIKKQQVEITIYQPQTENLDGVNIAGRAAISVKQGSNSPVFGAIWIDAILANDRASRMSSLTQLKVSNLKFADSVEEANLEKLKSIITQEITQWDWQIPTDQLITTYENNVDAPTDNYKNDPPEIILSKVPAMLIYIDGEPKTQAIEGMGNLVQVVNTPFCVVQDSQKGTYYILGEGQWYQSNKLTGTYQLVKKPSNNLKQIQTQVENSNKEDGVEITTSDKELQIIVRTQPAELLQIDGEPNLAPITETNLLYVSNSSNYIFLDIDSQRYYVNLSGRWYKSPALDGSWSYVSNSDLPSTFANIPVGSANDGVLANVPGTSASRDAILDNVIPQTAEVSRKSTSVDVEYDGTPVYKNVDGTSMQYIENSAQTVIRDGNKYYCVDNGIWFVSNTPNGPWEVATVRPQAVDNIAPSSPVYNVKYVYIYDVTPEVVYVGYTPGYYGSYVYNHTVIYGTGYRYDPWYGQRYYPRPLTYGFSMAYSPWSGWSIGWGVSYGGWFNFGWGGSYHHGGYWGVPAYRPPYAHPHPPHGYYGSHSRPSYYAPRRSQNVYSHNRPGVSSRPIHRNPSMNNRPNHRNDIYTDRNGSVYKNRGDNWQKRTDSGWDKVNSSGRVPIESNRPTGNRPSNNTNTNNNSNRTPINNNRPTGNNGSTTNNNRVPISNNKGVSNSNNRTPINNSRPVNKTAPTNNNRGTINSSNRRPVQSNSNANMNNLQQAAQNRQRSAVRTTNYQNATNTHRSTMPTRSAMPTRGVAGRGR